MPYSTWTNENTMKLFYPESKVVGIDYNYIVGIDQSRSPDATQDNPTLYDNGDIYGSIQMGKNMFNSQYSMDMPWLSTLTKCRSYCGILNSQGNIALKYYDCFKYTFNRRSKDTHGRVNAKKSFVQQRSTDNVPLYPY